MSTDILALHLSPRKEGNSAILLDAFIKGAESDGASVKRFSVADLEIKGCVECGSCEKDGNCVIPDDMQTLYPYLAETPLVVVSTPLFFYDVPAQGKAIIDRIQAIWCRRYVLNQTKEERPGTCGFLLALGATKGKDLFIPVTLAMKYFFDAMSLPKKFDSLCYRQVEAAGDINKHEDYLREAYEAGRAFAKKRAGASMEQGCS